MKKAFLTGATGFLGLNLIEKLLTEGWNVKALHLPDDNIETIRRPGVETVSGNILNYDSLINTIPAEIDAIFHIAGDISMWPGNAQRQYNINVNGTSNMCRAALEKKAKKFICTSSSSAFGFHSEMISETTPSNALTCGMNYNKTKYLAEQEVKKAVEQGLNAVILNPCNIIGPNDPGNWSQIIKNVYHNKLPGIPPGTGTFGHVDNIVNAHIAAVEKGRTGENYLLGGIEASFEEVITEIMKIAGREYPLKKISKLKLHVLTMIFSILSFFTRKEPVLTYPKYKRLTGFLSCDSSKAEINLGYRTSSLNEMLTDCYNWLKKEKLL